MSVFFFVTFVKPTENQLITKSIIKNNRGDGTRTFSGNFHYNKHNSNSLLRRGSNVRYINPLYNKVIAGAKSKRSITRGTSARCTSISRTSLSFSRTLIDFSALATFDSLKLTETHRLLFRYSLH